LSTKPFATIDYHTHSHHSADADAAMGGMAEAALVAGLAGLAFTEHVEWMPRDEACGYLQPAAYFEELAELRARYAGRLTLLAGVEVGSAHRFPDEARRLLDAWPWDVVLGSNHWAGGRAGWLPEAFEEGVDVAYDRYFREMVSLAEEGDYDVLGHFDVVRREARGMGEEPLDVAAYAEPIRVTLETVARRGKGLEINTSPWRYGLEQPCPEPRILRWFREVGGEILVLGTDGHRPEGVGRDFRRARALALEAGFTRLARIEGREVVGWMELE
jgi:histidinol-phosphatase (PHP family)